MELELPEAEACDLTPAQPTPSSCHRNIPVPRVMRGGGGSPCWERASDPEDSVYPQRSENHLFIPSDTVRHNHLFASNREGNQSHHSENTCGLRSCCGLSCRG